MGDPRLVPEAQTRSQSYPWARSRASLPSSHRIPEPLPSPAPRPPDLTPTLSPLDTRSSRAGSQDLRQGWGGMGWAGRGGGGVDVGTSRGKGIAAVFLEAQPLFSNSAKTTKSVLGNHSPNQKHNKNKNNKKNLFNFCGLRVMTLNLKRNKCHFSILPYCPMNNLYSRNDLFSNFRICL